MLYKLNKGFIKFVGKDSFESGELEDSTYFNNLDNDFYSTSLELIKEVLVEELLEKGYNSEDLEIVINACEENGRIDVNFTSTKEKSYHLPDDKSLKKFENGEINLYNVTLSFYVDTSTDHGKTYQNKFLEV